MGVAQAEDRGILKAETEDRWKGQIDNINKKVTSVGEEMIKKIEGMALQVQSLKMDSPKKEIGATPKQSRRSDFGRRTFPKPETTTAGPFEPGDRNIQCFRCGGWNHMGQILCDAGKSKLEGVKPGRALSKEDRREGPGVKIIKNAMQRGVHRYLNPDPWARLVGERNETVIKINQRVCKALIDSGAQLSQITKGHAKRLGLKIRSLEKRFGLEGAGGAPIPYHGYVRSYDRSTTGQSF